MTATTPTLSQARVRDAMHPGTLTCGPDSMLRCAAELMAAHGVHAIVVSNMDGRAERPWSIVTALDVAAAVAGAIDPSERVGRIAATEVLTVAPDATLTRAAQLMAEHEVSHLVVVDDGGSPIGVLSTLDLARVLAGSP